MRPLLLLPAILLECGLLAIGWVLAIACPRVALRLSHWASKTLPALDWYLGAGRKNEKTEDGL